MDAFKCSDQALVNKQMVPRLLKQYTRHLPSYQGVPSSLNVISHQQGKLTNIREGWTAPGTFCLISGYGAFILHNWVIYKQNLFLFQKSYYISLFTHLCKVNFSSVSQYCLCTWVISELFFLEKDETAWGSYFLPKALLVNDICTYFLFLWKQNLPIFGGDMWASRVR